jgi:hypothetical protein
MLCGARGSRALPWTGGRAPARRRERERLSRAAAGGALRPDGLLLWPRRGVGLLVGLGLLLGRALRLERRRVARDLARDSEL